MSAGDKGSAAHYRRRRGDRNKRDVTDPPTTYLCRSLGPCPDPSVCGGRSKVGTREMEEGQPPPGKRTGGPVRKGRRRKGKTEPKPGPRGMKTTPK